MSFMNREPLTGTHLRETRRSRLLRGTLRRTDGNELAVVVRNLSDHGLGLSSRNTPPPVGAQVTILVPGTPPLHGIVRWREGTNFGVELTERVDLGQITEALQNQRTQAQQTDWEVSRLHRVRKPEGIKPPRRIV